MIIAMVSCGLCALPNVFVEACEERTTLTETLRIKVLNYYRRCFDRFGTPQRPGQASILP